MEHILGTQNDRRETNQTQEKEANTGNRNHPAKLSVPGEKENRTAK
jgi:hypothetical protein